MHFSIGDNELLKKYNDIWNHVNYSIKKEFDSEPIYNKKFLKAKIKCYGDEATDFLNEEMAKVDSNYTCLAVIKIDFILKKDENYYLQVFLIECKYIEKEKMALRYITDDLENSFEDSDESDEKEIKRGFL